MTVDEFVQKNFTPEIRGYSETQVKSKLIVLKYCIFVAGERVWIVVRMNLVLIRGKREIFIAAKRMDPGVEFWTKV